VNSNISTLASAEVVIIDCCTQLEDAKRIATTYRDTYKSDSKLIAIVSHAQARKQIPMDLFDAGFDDYIVRPFSISDLSAKIRADVSRFSLWDVLGEKAIRRCPIIPSLSAYLSR